MTDTKRLLRVFLCHASGDKTSVKELYDHLVEDGIDAWLDKEKLIPGQDWETEISKAVKDSDAVIVCLSFHSITKEGFVQKEIKFALDIANEKPFGTIFIIPARLEDCEVPEQIRKYHWVDLYSDDGYDWLIKALKSRANNLGIVVKHKRKPPKPISESNPDVIDIPQDTRSETSKPKTPLLRRKSFYRRIYDYLIEHWFITLLLSTAPVWWFIFANVFWKNFGLMEDGKLTTLTSNILWFLFFISFLFTYLMTLANRYNEKATKAGQTVLTIMLESVNAIKYTKLRRYTKYINDHYGQRNSNPFIEAIQPRAQIENILINMQNALSQISDIHRSDISISLIYKTDKTPTWQWLFSVNTENDLKLEEVITNSNTTAKQIIDGKVDLIFFPDKRTGARSNQYVNAKKDLLHGNNGSVLCKNVGIATNEKSIQAILSISTYGLQLCAENDFNAIESITNLILPPFERRIQSELALLYIKEILSKPRIENK